MGTDPDYPGSKVYDVEAIHVTVSGNGRLYTKAELEEATLTLAYRPLDINHDSSRILDYPANTTLATSFVGNGIKTRIRVVDASIIGKIESGIIKHVSVSQVSNETCADSTCSTKLQYGMAFTRLALLENASPGDPNARIIKGEMLITDLLKKEYDAGVDSNIPMQEDNKPECPDGQHWCDKEKHCMPDAKAEDEKEDDKNETNNSLNDKSVEKDIMVDSKKEETKTEVKTEEKPVTGSGPNADIKSIEKQIEKETPIVKAYDREYWENFKNAQQSAMETLAEKIGTYIKFESKPSTPSTQVDDSTTIALASKKEETDRVVSFFSNIRKAPKSTSETGVSWSLDKDEYMKSHGYNPTFQAPTPQTMEKGEVANSPTTTNTFGINFSKQVLFVPGGRMKVPIRQFCNYVSLDGQDTANWYTINGVNFAVYVEGTAITASTQTVTRVQSVPAIRGALEYVGYSQIESAPYDLVGAINEANMTAAIDDETTDVLDTVYNAVTVTNWVNGNTGAALAAANDDVASMTFKRDGILGGKRLIASQGHDVSPGNLVLFIHPKNWQDLMADTNLNNFYQYARPGITALGVLEQLYGVDIVIADQVKAQTNTTNNTYRNVMAQKGTALGMSSGRDVLMEAQRRNEIQQVLITATQRVKGAVIDETRTARISGAQ